MNAGSNFKAGVQTQTNYTSLQQQMTPAVVELTAGDQDYDEDNVDLDKVERDFAFLVAREQPLKESRFTHTKGAPAAPEQLVLQVGTPASGSLSSGAPVNVLSGHTSVKG